MKKLWNRKTVLNNVVDLLSHFKSTLIERMISRTSKKRQSKKALITLSVIIALSFVLLEVWGSGDGKLKETLPLVT